MASIFKRKNENGTTVWRAIVRIKGYPTVCNHFDRKQEGEDWSANVEPEIKAGEFKFDQHKKIHTFSELLARYIQDGALEHHRSAEDTKRHLDYWGARLGSYGLIHITPELLGKERQLLADTPFIVNQPLIDKWLINNKMRYKLSKSGEKKFPKRQSESRVILGKKRPQKSPKMTHFFNPLKYTVKCS